MMKNLNQYMKQFFVLIAAMTLLFSCKKDNNVRELPSGTDIQVLPSDPELFNFGMDRAAAVKRKNNPHNPPTTHKQGYLLLDFNGEDVTNTQFTSETISCANSGLSDFKIQEAVTKAKYYFSQFNVEVGTSEDTYNSYPQNKRRRCVITTTNFYGNVGGVAYINSFNWFDNTPCFVFSQLLQFNSKYIADAIAHELGHTLGCWHHVELRNDEGGVCYVYGNYLWGFHIMGASYYDSNPIFTIGERDCNSQTNDIINISNSINL